MKRAWLVVLFAIFATTASAQEPTCNEDSGYPLATATSELNPARFTGSCVCINWDAPTEIETHHYHVFVDEMMVSAQEQRAYLHCSPAKDATHKIEVDAIAGWRKLFVVQVGSPYYLRWTDINPDPVCVQWSVGECLDGERIVPCP